ncbi:MAG: hypothetical protein RRY38_00525 [Oscillospiraceae bacterium]
MNAARETGVNPYYLAAKIRGEIGASKSRSVTGDVAGLEGLYNYYNIGATDGSGNIERALEYAGAQGSYGRPWNTPEKAIVGGARFIAADYVSLGQDTGYLQKFNVAPYTATTKHLHQYMTNVSGAAAQASSAFNGYAKIEMLDMPIEFSIPVFENMPFESRSADELADSTGQSQLAISRANVGIRSAPHLASSSVGELPLGGVVKVSTAVKTDAAHWHSWLIAPFWYCIEYVSPGGRSVEGFVSAEWLELGAFRVLSEGGRATMNVLAQPVGSDDDIRYLSRDDAVATVDKEGVITALGEGRTSIVAYTSGGAFYERSVIVTPNPAQRDDIADE